MSQEATTAAPSTAAPVTSPAPAAPADAASAPQDAQPEVSTPAPQGDGKAGGAAPTAASPGTPPAPVVEPPAPDAAADALAAFNREAREVSKIKATLLAKEKDFGNKVALAEKAEKVAGLLAAKDYLGALMAADETLNPDEAAVMLLEQANARSPKQLTEEDVKKAAQAEVERIQKEAAEKAQAEHDKRVSDSNAMYLEGCVREFEAAKDKFKLVGVFGVSDEKILAHLRKQFDAGAGVPPPVGSLQYFEDYYERRLAEAGYTKAQIQDVKDGKTAAPATETKSPATAPTADVGGVITPEKPAPRESLADYDRRVKAGLRAARATAR